MSSPPKEKAETRAGHPPAVKAGGMRIVQKHPHTSDSKEDKDKDDQDWETTRTIEPNTHDGTGALSFRKPFKLSQHFTQVVNNLCAVCKQ
uniref:Death associated protein n=1 Tax=Crocodylus porosus TaxID=8502 RepID=A0A7M4F9C1_CROPO